MAKNRICKKTVGDDSILFEFANGATVTVTLDQFNAEILKRSTIHGLSQKLGDSYAGAENADEGQAAFEQTLATITGDNATWTTKAAGGGVARSTMLVEALMAATGRELDEAIEAVASLDEQGKKDLRAHPSIAAELAKIKATKAAEKAAKAAEAAKDAPALSL